LPSAKLRINPTGENMTLYVKAEFVPKRELDVFFIYYR
jgi:hypothetical protein